jgi:polyisoprenyl-teichoic acid--peptidoglycan teichoic acid transferase
LSRTRTILSVIGGLVLVAAIAVGARAWSSWNKPLGASLGLPTSTSGPTTTQASTLQPGITPSLSPTFTATSAPLCGGPPVMTILAIGVGWSEDNYNYGLSDVMRIVRVDFVTPRITVLDLPRDLWVEIPDIAAHYGIDHGKLNQAYLYGNPGMGYYDGPGEGPGLLARTLQKNFGISVDHYGAINMLTFVKVVDAVGGIDVYLPEDVDGRPVDSHTADMGYFNAGHQHLNGAAALRLARIRKKYSVFKRSENQNIVVCALKDRILTPAVFPKVPKIAQSFFGSVQTDLSPAQIGQLACVLPKVSEENLMFASVPQDLFKPSRVYDPFGKYTTFVWDIDRDVLQDYIDRFVSGEWPQPSTDGEPTCPPPQDQ